MKSLLPLILLLSLLQACSQTAAPLPVTPPQTPQHYFAKAEAIPHLATFYQQEELQYLPGNKRLELFLHKPLSKFLYEGKNFSASINLLGILYRRAGALGSAQQWYEFGSKHSINPAAIASNYLLVVQELNDSAAITRLETLLLQSNDDNPYNWLTWLNSSNNTRPSVITANCWSRRLICIKLTWRWPCCICSKITTQQPELFYMRRCVTVMNKAWWRCIRQNCRQLTGSRAGKHRLNKGIRRCHIIRHQPVWC